jgi:hypothetical protein
MAGWVGVGSAANRRPCWRSHRRSGAVQRSRRKRECRITRRSRISAAEPDADESSIGNSGYNWSAAHGAGYARRYYGLPRLRRPKYQLLSAAATHAGCSAQLPPLRLRSSWFRQQMVRAVGQCEPHMYMDSQFICWGHMRGAEPQLIHSRS